MNWLGCFCDGVPTRKQDQSRPSRRLSSSSSSSSSSIFSVQRPLGHSGPLKRGTGRAELAIYLFTYSACGWLSAWWVPLVISEIRDSPPSLLQK
jgi:hypothetical protein